MAKELYEDDQFRIVMGHDFVVIRKDYPYEFHSHFHKYAGAITLVKLFYKKLQPADEYFYVAMQRITTENEFNTFSPQKRKQMYYNINKGVRRNRR